MFFDIILLTRVVGLLLHGLRWCLGWECPTFLDFPEKYGNFHKFMENSINLWKFPYFSGKSMNVGHCHPKHHCNPCNSSPTTLVSIIISKNIMLSIQNNLWSEKHTLPSCGVARIQLPGGLARARESPGGPAHGLFFASKIRCPLTKNALTFFSDKIFA